MDEFLGRASVRSPGSWECNAAGERSGECEGQGDPEQDTSRTLHPRHGSFPKGTKRRRAGPDVNLSNFQKYRNDLTRDSLERGSDRSLSSTRGFRGFRVNLYGQQESVLYPYHTFTLDELVTSKFPGRDKIPSLSSPNRNRQKEMRTCSYAASAK